MTYTFTPTGWYVTFDPKRSDGGIMQTPVEAWSPEGKALVVDHKGGGLVSASSRPGFLTLEPCGKVVGVLPAQPGWHARFAEGGDDFTLPVLGWAVDAEGRGLPLVPSVGDGELSVADPNLQPHTLIEPTTTVSDQR